MNNPVDLVSNAFTGKHPAFMPYFTLGYPDYERSLQILEACAAAGSDMMELWMPFSDPLADGPTIQHSSQIALQNGMNVARCLEAIAELRTRGVTIPLLLMGYYNPILAYGETRFAREAVDAGANGFIIPDLPPEEASTLETECQQHGLALTYLLAPTSTEARIKLVAKKASGFVYLVSLTGVTGERIQLPKTLSEFVKRVRHHIHHPLAVGFGISTPVQAQQVGEIADGVIVGSKLITLAREADNPAEACGTFVHNMITALHSNEKA